MNLLFDLRNASLSTKNLNKYSKQKQQRVNDNESNNPHCELLVDSRLAVHLPVFYGNERPKFAHFVQTSSPESPVSASVCEDTSQSGIFEYLLLDIPCQVWPHVSAGVELTHMVVVHVQHSSLQTLHLWLR